MRIIFEAIVKENGIGGWYLEIKDTMSNRVEKCNDLEEFSFTIEKMGEDYGGHIDEVKWQVDSNVTAEHLSEVKAKMANYYKELFNNSKD
ncbi:hypothetical protein [Malaciobacter mytili]|uniref:Uncharacterized protein n=1 Tax=Malaciobacter mytili LMG 24559 TaxID=1032238 RepID=A0AAX2AJY3_9BACT|nr:hypothetical protein [Malaciobacter mytili]AXH15861.1 hypothetical protein AMYT_2326 [Malaciobacter mytili LMG 24559]RXI46198.1 hypothetical protein CRU99_03125 [Malaciobacter mytili]RXK15881.1 hypothetical protein CP985_05830 [Malaciobacter mytili LMG 24559]